MDLGSFRRFEAYRNGTAAHSMRRAVHAARSKNEHIYGLDVQFIVTPALTYALVFLLVVVGFEVRGAPSAGAELGTPRYSRVRWSSLSVSGLPGIQSDAL